MDHRDRLIEAGIDLAGGHGPQELLRRTIELAVELTGAAYGALGVLAEDGRQLVDFLTVGLDAPAVARIGDPPVGRGLLGAMIDDQHPMLVPDIGADPRSAGFPAGHPPMRTLLGVPIVSRGNVIGDLYLTDKANGDFDDDDLRAVKVLASQAAVAIESARRLAAERLRSDTLDASAAVRDTILAGSPEDEIMRTLAARARVVIDADMTLVASCPPGSPARILAIDGASLPAGAVLPADGICSEVVDGDRAVAVDDLRGDPRIRDAERPDGMARGVFASLGLSDQVRGALAAYRADGRPPFSSGEVESFASLAQGTGLVFAYAKARRDAERAVVLSDRERIARDLHDGVIQSLFAVGMGLQGAAMASDDPATVVRLEAAVDEIDRVVRDVRNYIFGLRPGVLADRQLAAAITDVAREFEERSGVVVATEVDEWVASELSSAAADVLQMLRESLSNVGRHAGAATCRVSLTRDGDAAVLVVDDDGAGFDPPSATRGLGLTNLEDRARALGGSLTLESSPGSGTLVRFRLPL